MHKEITYPRRGSKEEDVLNQELLNRLTAEVMNWRQGAGVIGGLYLHSGWGEATILERRYQGQTTSFYYDYVNGAMKLYDRTGNPRWKVLADDIISNLLFLQCPDGGFRHASKEFEPSFTSGATCPVHQAFPVLALLSYAVWPHATPALQELIKPAVDRHWAWFHNRWWMKGPGNGRVLKTPGWCGVTNQDLTVIAALSTYGRVYGDWSRYDTYGKPALDETYFSPRYYHEKIGLFERGDADNLTERTLYFAVIFSMLNKIYEATADERIPGILDTCADHLFDAVYTGDDGMTHLAWGARTDPRDKSYVAEWQKKPIILYEYPLILDEMERWLTRHPHAERQVTLNRLRETFCAYVFYDGVLPGALWPVNNIVSVAAAPHCPFWYWLIERLGDAVHDPEPVGEVCLHRKIGNYTWKRKGQLWAVERDGRRLYGGYTPLTFGVTRGEEPAIQGDYADLDTPDVVEILSEM